ALSPRAGGAASRAPGAAAGAAGTARAGSAPAAGVPSWAHPRLDIERDLRPSQVGVERGPDGGGIVRFDDDLRDVAVASHAHAGSRDFTPGLRGEGCPEHARLGPAEGDDRAHAYRAFTTFLTFGRSLKKILDPHRSHWMPTVLMFVRIGSLQTPHLYIRRPPPVSPHPPRAAPRRGRRS